VRVGQGRLVYTVAMKGRHVLLAALALALWTAFLGFMYQRETALEEERLSDIALSQARALYNQVVDVRDWNASHGGVYVPVTAATPPTPGSMSRSATWSPPTDVGSR